MSLHDKNIEYTKALIRPRKLHQLLPSSPLIEDFVIKSRQTIENIIKGKDKRLLCVVGPCSIHDTKSAFEYAQRLKDIAQLHENKLFIVMRTYFEKPRTTIGWKGLINDPHLNNSFNVNEGLYLARKLLLDINKLGLPCGYEILDSITPQYIADLISWGAVGARTTESQVHRQIVSGLSMPVGFKNSTNGSIKAALDAIVCAKNPHCFMGISQSGDPCICKTKGNAHAHLILRGGENRANYYPKDVKETLYKIKEYNCDKKNIDESVIIDCSHGNSSKDYKKQHVVFENVIMQKKIEFY